MTTYCVEQDLQCTDSLAALTHAINNARRVLAAIPEGSSMLDLAHNCTLGELRERYRRARGVEQHITRQFGDAPEWTKKAEILASAIHFRQFLDARRPAKSSPKGAVDYKKLKADLDIIEVVGRYTQLRRQGRSWVGLCPFHGDKRRPNLVVWREPAVFKCFSCGARGDVVTFLKRIGAEVA